MKVSDLKVLELASVLAGPQVGSFFAELGAHVIKVENKTTGGDVTRNWRLPNEAKEKSISAYYASANTGKESILLDFKDKTEIQQVHDLVRKSDLVLVNFKPGDASRFGLEYEDLKRLNPKLIYGEITGFGPQNNRTAFDVILQAETGYISMTGNENQLAKLPVAFIDLFAAHQLKAGILLALLEGRKPAKVSVSLFDAAIASLANQASNYLMEKHIAKPIGTRHPNIAPYGDLFTTQDEKSIVLAIGSEKQFSTLMELLKTTLPEAYDSNQKRVVERKNLIAFLSPLIAQWTQQEFLEACHEHKIPAGGVYNLEEVFQQNMAKSLVIKEQQEGVNTQKVKTAVFTISS